MAKENEEVKDTEAAAKPKKLMGKLIILAVLVVAVGSGGFFGYKWYAGKQAKDQAAQTEEDVKIVYPLKSFIVNLIDKQGVGKRYLKVAMEIEVGGEEKKVFVDQHIPQLRDTVLLLLSSRSLKEINTLEGKLELKQALLSRMNRVLGEAIIERVYFTEFVVQ